MKVCEAESFVSLWPQHLQNFITAGDWEVLDETTFWERAGRIKDECASVRIRGLYTAQCTGCFCIHRFFGGNSCCQWTLGIWNLENRLLHVESPTLAAVQNCDFSWSCVQCTHDQLMSLLPLGSVYSTFIHHHHHHHTQLQRQKWNLETKTWGLCNFIISMQRITFNQKQLSSPGKFSALITCWFSTVMISVDSYSQLEQTLKTLATLFFLINH